MSKRVSGPGSTACPCDLDAEYAQCCGRFHRGSAPAPTAVALMRSRYSAFVIRDTSYLLRTWAPGDRPGSLTVDRTLRWVGLEILGTTGGSAFHRAGTVEFVARYLRAGEPGELRENSRFERVGGVWVYTRPVSGA